MKTTKSNTLTLATDDDLLVIDKEAPREGNHERSHLSDLIDEEDGVPFTFSHEPLRLADCADDTDIILEDFDDFVAIGMDPTYRAAALRRCETAANDDLSVWETDFGTFPLDLFVRH